MSVTHYRDLHVSMAAGSAAELQTQLLLAQSLQFADPGVIKQHLDLCEQVSKMLYRLQQSLVQDAGDRSPVPSPRSRK